jgi:hypothetical protein
MYIYITIRVTGSSSSSSEQEYSKAGLQDRSRNPWHWLKQLGMAYNFKARKNHSQLSRIRYKMTYF